MVFIEPVLDYRHRVKEVMRVRSGYCDNSYSAQQRLDYTPAHEEISGSVKTYDCKLSGATAFHNPSVGPL
jgi:hypothetical protein